MNKKRIRQLADHIEGLNHSQFDMDRWVRTDGRTYYSSPPPVNATTQACVAGWAVILFGAQVVWPIGWYAAKLLGLNEDQRELFFSTVRKPTPAHVAKVLRHFADTGEIQWE
jgi:hypothetical protein